MHRPAGCREGPGSFLHQAEERPEPACGLEAPRAARGPALASRGPGVATAAAHEGHLLAEAVARSASVDDSPPYGCGPHSVAPDLDLLPLYTGVMTNEAEALLREALALPDEDRADVAAELLASLDSPVADDPAVVRDLWSQELQRRARRVLSGEAVGEDWSAVRQRLADELTE